VRKGIGGTEKSIPQRIDDVGERQWNFRACHSDLAAIQRHQVVRG
jgi:hypothetical protein